MEVLTIREVQDRYPILPQWWSEVEVPYGFYNTMPYIIIYTGPIYQRSTREAIWDVMFQSEWAFSVAIHLFWKIMVNTTSSSRRYSLFVS